MNSAVRNRRSPPGRNADASRLLAALALLVSLVAGVGCPDPADVGAIPGDTVKDARARIHSAERVEDKRAAEAAAVGAEPAAADVKE